MDTPLQCLALRMVRYNDRTQILTAYSRERGRVSLAIPASAGRSAARVRAVVQPMAVFECRADIRPDREIYTPRDIRALVLPPSGNPVAAVQAMFCADLLSGLLRESISDAHLFGFLRHAAEVLSAAATAPGSGALLANYHIALMLGLTRPAGIEPDWGTYRSGHIFDMAEGTFRVWAPAHTRFLQRDEAAVAYSLRRMTLANAHRWRLSRADRNTILDRLLTYYQVHFPGLGGTEGVEVLRHLFDF